MEIDEVSKLCSTFSVAQKPSSISTMARSFHSFDVIFPSASSWLRIVARPPSISAISGFIMRVMMKYTATLISAENGAPAMNHSSQVIVV